MNFNVPSYRVCLFAGLFLVVCHIHISEAQDTTQQEIYRSSLQVNALCVPQPGVDTWYGADKFRHVAASMITTTFLIQITAGEMDWNTKDSEIFAAGTTLSLGFVKELYDRRRPGNHFCWKDLTADFVGVLLGWAVTRIR